MTNYVVTGHVFKANRRCRLSHELPEIDAHTLRDNIERQMSIATPANRWVEDIQVDEVETL